MQSLPSPPNIRPSQATVSSIALVSLMFFRKPPFSSSVRNVTELFDDVHPLLRFTRILGKTDREVSELVGVRRKTITKWHKNPFFTAVLNVKRDALWTDAKLRLKALVHEAVNTLTSGLHSTDEKIAITAAVRILKVTGLYEKGGVGSIDLPKTPEEAVWAQTVENNTKLYKGVRPDAFTDWSTRDWTKDTGKSLAIKWVDGEYEKAVDEQKKELREYKKKAKAQTQLPQIEPVPLTIEEDLSQCDRPEAIKA